MSTSALIVALVRELLPFLKEALLEGQTLRVWLKANWLTFVWLINSLVLTLLIALQADVVGVVSLKERQVNVQLNSIVVPMQRLIEDHKFLRNENAELKALNQQLLEEKATTDETLLTYEEWMEKCGVDYQNGGSCKVTKSAPPPRRPATRPKSRPQQQAQQPPIQPPRDEPAQQTPPKKSGFFHRLREAMSPADPPPEPQGES